MEAMCYRLRKWGNRYEDRIYEVNVMRKPWFLDKEVEGIYHD
jgi:hypothetical protein